MPESADRQLNRILQLVADLSQAARRGDAPATLTVLSERYGAKPSVILQDLRILTEAGGDADDTWLSSLTVEQEEDRVSVQSYGPYRRPIKLTLDELVVLKAAVATEPEAPSSILPKFRSLTGVPGDPGDPIRAIPGTPGEQGATVATAERAMRERRALRLVYLGEGAEAPTDRIVEVHDMVSAIGRHYLIAWCRKAGAWRRFRADRALGAEVLDDVFTWRPDVPLVEDRSDLFQPPADGTDDVRVRFSPQIARWISERYPQSEPQPDGSVIVTFVTASVNWLVRHVLQYGDEAEVLEPAAYRDAVRRVVA